MCPVAERWPYACPAGCAKRAHCGFPTCSYDARSAHEAYRARLSSSRSGISLTEEELAEMDALVTPLVRQGQGFEAIWATHGDELPVCVRTAYSHQAAGMLSCASIELPRVVRVRPRRRAGDAPPRDRVDRAGATYEDFMALPLEERARVVELDSVCGLQSNRRDVLSLMPVAAGFQLYLLKGHGDPRETVRALDRLEAAMGSREAFLASFGLVLADRGGRVRRPRGHGALLSRAGPPRVPGLLLRPDGVQPEVPVRAQPRAAQARPAEGQGRLRPTERRRRGARVQPRQLVPAGQARRALPSGARRAAVPGRRPRAPRGRTRRARPGDAAPEPAAARGDAIGGFDGRRRAGDCRRALARGRRTTEAAVFDSLRIAGLSAVDFRE